MRPVLLGVDLVQVLDDDGNPRLVPDVGIGVREAFWPSGPDRYTAAWNGDSLTVYRLGVWNSKLWFYGSGSKDILVRLAHLGASVKLISELTPAQKQTLITTFGLLPIRRVSDNAVVGVAPPVVFAGESPVAVGMADELVEGEEYYAG